MQRTRGRPPKYRRLAAGLDVGEETAVWRGDSERYAIKLAWSLNSGRIELPDGEFVAWREDNPLDGWVVYVERTG